MSEAMAPELVVSIESARSTNIEPTNTASLATRIANPVLFATVRLGLETLTALGQHLPVTSKQVFAMTNLLDAPAAVLAPTRGTHRKMVEFDDFRAEWLWRDDTADALAEHDSALLYLHGGGFIGCGLNTHRRMVARIGDASKLPVLNVDYRQLPKAHLVETLEDCIEAYRYLLAEGFAAERIILAGDSAGGGLAFLVALAARDRGLPMPGAISVIAPWSDLDNTARLAHRNNGWRDPVIPPRGLGVVAEWGFRVDGTLDPAWSPANNDFTGLPPVFIQVGSTETLQADAEQLAQRCAEAGVPCTLQIWDRAPHVFHIGADLLPDARAAIRAIGVFNQQALANRTEPARNRAPRLVS